MFNLFINLKNTISNLTKVIKSKNSNPTVMTETTLVNIPVSVSTEPKVRKPRKTNPLQEIDNLFTEVMLENNWTYVKGPNAGLPVAKVEKVKFVRQPKEVFAETTGLIAAGKKGISNTQMIPAMKAHIDNLDNLRTLQTTYPEVFASSIKYMSKKEQEVLTTIVPVNV